MKDAAADIRAHIERHIGPIAQVFRSTAADAVPIDVLHVAPNVERPLHTLITSGLSAQAMRVPVEIDAPRHIELMVTLPEKWQVKDAFAPDNEWNWPINQLARLARLPHERDTWLGWGQTIPNGDPPRSFAVNTKLCGVIIVPSLLVPTAFYELALDDYTIAFFGLVPLYREELALQERDGWKQLLSTMIDRDIRDVVDPHRRNVAKRFGWPF